jgi:hypothetical protein
MVGQCCMGGGRSRRLARRLAGSAASVLPGAVLMALPKCPLCIVAWLAVAGIGVSAGAVVWMRGLIVALWVAAIVITAVYGVRRLRKVRVTPACRDWRERREIAAGG